MAQHYYDSERARDIVQVVPDLIRARWLLFDMARKDFRVRYRYAVLGVLWAVIEPVALMLILTFVFSVLLKAKLAGAAEETTLPFPIFVLSGLIFWQFFSTALSTATHSLVENQNLVEKIRFPREVLPLAALGFPLLNLGIGLIILALLHFVLGGALSVTAWVLPLLFLIQLTLVAGLGMALSCAHVQFRDVGYMMGVALLFGFYASPIFYAADLVRQQGLPVVEALYFLNPMAGLLTAYRMALFENTLPPLSLLAWPAVAALIALIAGVILCRRKGPILSDYL